MNKYLLRVMSFVALFALAVATTPANAAGIDPTKVLPGADGEIDVADVAANGYATTSIQWTNATADRYVTSTVFYVTIKWSGNEYWATNNSGQVGTSSNLLPCHGNPAIFGAEWTAGNYYTNGKDTYEMTFSLNEITDSVGPSGLCVRVPVVNAAGKAPVTGNFSFAFLASGASGDFGATEYYSNGGNDVNVHGMVGPTLEFVIVSSTLLTREKHDCALGEDQGVSTMDAGATSTCNYRLKISTNAANGFEVNVQANHDLATGFATITNVVEDEIPTIYDEAYGIEVIGAVDGGRHVVTGLFTEPVTEEGDFADDWTPVPTATAPLFVSYSDGFTGTSTLSTTKVTHAATISLVTPAGYYSQLVTYSITPDF